MSYRKLFNVKIDNCLRIFWYTFYLAIKFKFISQSFVLPTKGLEEFILDVLILIILLKYSSKNYKD